MREKRILSCFSFFLLVLGTEPRVYTLSKHSSPAHFSFLLKLLILREDLTQLPRKPLCLWQSCLHLPSTQSSQPVPPGLSTEL